MSVKAFIKTTKQAASRLTELRIKPFCTCGAAESKKLNPELWIGFEDRHYLRCDLMYGKNSSPKKRKRLGIFYPLKVRGK